MTYQLEQLESGQVRAQVNVRNNQTHLAVSDIHAHKFENPMTSAEESFWLTHLQSSTSLAFLGDTIDDLRKEFGWNSTSQKHIDDMLANRDCRFRQIIDMMVGLKNNPNSPFEGAIAIPGNHDRWDMLEYLSKHELCSELFQIANDVLWVDTDGKPILHGIHGHEQHKAFNQKANLYFGGMFAKFGMNKGLWWYPNSLLDFTEQKRLEIQKFYSAIKSNGNHKPNLVNQLLIAAASFEPHKLIKHAQENYETLGPAIFGHIHLASEVTDENGKVICYVLDKMEPQNERGTFAKIREDGVELVHMNPEFNHLKLNPQNLHYRES